MKQTKKVLVSAADTFDLPADIIAGLPRMEIIGSVRFSMEPHKGLMEYSQDRITVDSLIGPVTVLGCDLVLHQMSRSKISVSGKILSVSLGDGTIE